MSTQPSRAERQQTWRDAVHEGRVIRYEDPDTGNVVAARSFLTINATLKALDEPYEGLRLVRVHMSYGEQDRHMCDVMRRLYR